MKCLHCGEVVATEPDVVPPVITVGHMTSATGDVAAALELVARLRAHETTEE